MLWYVLAKGERRPASQAQKTYVPGPSCHAHRLQPTRGPRRGILRCTKEARLEFKLKLLLLVYPRHGCCSDAHGKVFAFWTLHTGWSKHAIEDFCAAVLDICSIRAVGDSEPIGLIQNVRKRIFIHPLNRVCAPDPLIPPRLLIEF